MKAPATDFRSGGRPDDRRTNAAGLSVNGQDESLNNWVVDGIDDNERVIGTIGVKPNVEGIQEITVQTNSYAPEAGRTAGGVINIVTRSGTEPVPRFGLRVLPQRHLRRPQLLPDELPRDRSPSCARISMAAASAARFIKDRTFFYFDYEGFRQVRGITDTGTVPTIQRIRRHQQPERRVARGAAEPIERHSQDISSHQSAHAQLSRSCTRLLTNGNLVNNFTISPNLTQNYNTYDAQGRPQVQQRQPHFWTLHL